MLGTGEIGEIYEGIIESRKSTAMRVLPVVLAGKRNQPQTIASISSKHDFI
jgi:hypothetical protein